MDSSKLVVYTSEKCPSCKRIKAILKKENIEFDVVNVDVEENFIEALMHNIATVPTLRIGNKKLFAKKSTTQEIKDFIEKSECLGGEYFF